MGDSLGIDLGDQLQTQLTALGAQTTMAATGDTGLANVAYFDWPEHLAADLGSHPTLVVVFLGANDDQGLYSNGTPFAPGASGWDTAYAHRVDTMLSDATTSGAMVVWVGMPTMADPHLSAWMTHVDGIFKGQVAQHHDALYLDSAAVFSQAPGQTPLRTPDGVHLTPAGGSVLATAVIADVRQHWPGLLGTG